MPELDVATANGPQRVFSLLDDALPVLLSLGERGAMDITSSPHRVRRIDARYQVRGAVSRDRRVE